MVLNILYVKTQGSNSYFFTLPNQILAQGTGTSPAWSISESRRAERWHHCCPPALDSHRGSCCPWPGPQGRVWEDLHATKCLTQNRYEEESVRFWTDLLPTKRTRPSLYEGPPGGKYSVPAYCWTSRPRAPHCTRGPESQLQTHRDRSYGGKGNVTLPRLDGGVSEKAKVSAGHALLAILNKLSHLVSFRSWGDTTFLPKTAQEDWPVGSSCPPGLLESGLLSLDPWGR